MLPEEARNVREWGSSQQGELSAEIEGLSRLPRSEWDSSEAEETAPPPGGRKQCKLIGPQGKSSGA